ncbi:hypothetical protein NJ7G_1552 [Natrinema sp. J7-2]|nr:hypothetical protein NJ7G_1552 [Natrinema sp. J7-2]
MRLRSVAFDRLSLSSAPVKRSARDHDALIFDFGGRNGPRIVSVRVGLLRRCHDGL